MAKAVVAALLRGAAPTPVLARPIAFDAVHSLRWLDKRRDFCRALRFPDVLPNCFNAASAHYRTMDTQRDVLAIHRDPLSFCLQITQREDGDSATPVGFAFGSFGLTTSGPVALLSGLYLRRRNPELRASGLAAIEEARSAGRSGLVSLAISARFAGAGPMPPGLRVRVAEACAGSAPSPRLSRTPRDDLGLTPNVEAQPRPRRCSGGTSTWQPGDAVLSQMAAVSSRARRPTCPRSADSKMSGIAVSVWLARTTSTLRGTSG